MYQHYFGFSGQPFQCHPDPAFYFGSLPHRRAMDYLVYGLHRNEGFIVITGEVGSGKTTLVRAAISQLDPEKHLCAHLLSTQVDADNVLPLVAAAFGLPTAQAGKAALLIALEAFLCAAYRAGKRALLVVDEAQNLSLQAIEELRMLSNFQCNAHVLLQSLLIAQPEFRATLQSVQMTSLRQRVVAACHIGALDADDTRLYIEHRLRHVGWQNTPLFAPEAFAAIHLASAGIARCINALCERLLWSAFLSNTSVIGAVEVQEIALEMDAETRAPLLFGATDVCSVTAAAQAEPLMPSRPNVLLPPAEPEAPMARIAQALDGLLRTNTSAQAVLGQLLAALEVSARGESA